MDRKLIKNIGREAALPLAAQVDVLPGRIVSLTLAQNKSVSLTLFSFSKGEEISEHDSTGDAMALVLEGAGEFTVGGTAHLVKAGETLVMPAGIPHAVSAPEDFKMLLIVVFPHE